jgi:hypothetical protein
VRLSRRSGLPVVAIAVGDALRRHGIHAVLTGGACASVHCGGRSQSVDVDFVLSGTVTQDALDAAMRAVGFRRLRDRYVHVMVPFFVEFPTGPLAVGGDFRIRPVERRLRGARTLALSPTDSCRDRLAAFYHWRDRQSLRTAVAIALRNRVSQALIRSWSADEGHAEGYAEFVRELQRARSERKRRAGGRGRGG